MAPRLNYREGDQPVDGYRLVAFLGRGNFGEVWKASGPGGVEVALKIIGDLGRKKGGKELRALRLVKSIRHPNLLPITAFWLKDAEGNLVEGDSHFDSDKHHQEPFRGTMSPTAFTEDYRPEELVIAMGLAETSLFHRLQECLNQGLDGIPLVELLTYMADAARAIDLLNVQHNIQHCDIKPQNIVIVGGGAQVCDFGLATALGNPGEESMTAGSIAYGAPELFSQSGPSHSSDQYSLAVSYCELRTGHLPFRSDQFGEVMRAKQDGALDLTLLTPEERRVIEQATALRPDERFPKIREMISALSGCFSEDAAVRIGGIDPRTLHRSADAMNEIVPGYRKNRLLFQDETQEVWEATAPGQKRVALLIHSHGNKRPAVAVDREALQLTLNLRHPYLSEPHAFWLLDEKNMVIPDQLLDGPDPPRPARLVIAGRLSPSNLKKRLDECRQTTGLGIPIDELMQYMEQIAEAVDFLHSPQHQVGGQLVAIQHGNLRCHNFLLENNMVTVGNLAHVRRMPSDVVTCNWVEQDENGYWTPPEFKKGQLSRWSDQYSLAIAFVEMRTGNEPGEDCGELSGLSFAEAEVLRQATADDPFGRFTSCGEMVRALREACAGDPSPAPSIDPSMASADPELASIKREDATPNSDAASQQEEDAIGTGTMMVQPDGGRATVEWLAPSVATPGKADAEELSGGWQQHQRRQHRKWWVGLAGLAAALIVLALAKPWSAFQAQRGAVFHARRATLQRVHEALRTAPDEAYRRADELLEDLAIEDPLRHGLLGEILIHQSQRSRDSQQQVRILKQAAAECNRAMESNDEKEWLALYQVTRSQACLQLAHSSQGAQLGPIAIERSLQQALADAQAVTEVDTPYRSDAFRALGNALESQASLTGQVNNYAKAVKALSAAIQRQDDVAKTWVDRGRCRVNMVLEGGHPKEILNDAIVDLNQAIHLDDRQMEAYVCLCQVYLHQEAYDQADAQLSVAIRLEPDYHPAWYWKGMIAASKGEFPSADTHLAKAIRLATQTHAHEKLPYLVDWAKTLDPREPQNDNRLPRLEAVADELGDDPTPEVCLFVGAVREVQGNWMDAIDRYDRALQREPTVADVTARLLKRRSQARLWSSARAELLQGGDSQIIRDADQAAEQARDPQLKAAAFVQAAESRIWAAEVLAAEDPQTSRGLRAESIENCRQAIDIAPDDPISWYPRYLLVREWNALDPDFVSNPGQRRQARQYLREASQRYPADRNGVVKEWIDAKLRDLE